MDLGPEAMDSHAPSVLHLLPHHARHLHYRDSEQIPSCKSNNFTDQQTQAVPQITNEFRSLSNVGWYGAAYQLASGALQPLTGKLYVNFKNKWVFISFFALFELGSLICGVAPSSNVLIVGRAIQGMGTAGLQNGAFTIISAAVPLVQRPGLIGACQGIAQLGAVIGPLVGGALTQYST
jgi:MFS family permease